MSVIENLLRKTIGLHTPAIGSSMVERAVRLRMRIHGLTKQDDYLILVEQSPSEWDALLDSVLVTETCFFRDKTPFLAMVGLVLDEWSPAHPDRILRVLSVPCASGEEPYSIAMALLDAGFPGMRIQIDAVDISARALACARSAVYNKNSFRGRDLNFRARYFHPADESYVLDVSVRKLVRFQRGNILDHDCLAETEAYDFIFCRNLLIYFDAPTQERTLSKLHRLLTPSGILFAGAAEMPLAMNRGFTSTNLPLSFACRKTDTLKKSSEPSRWPSGQQVHANPPRRAAHSLTPMARSGFFPSMSDAKPAMTGLEKARQLANEGRMAEAEEICETHLREQGASAEAFYLLGTARHATGADSQAGEFYRKALYLEPTHYDTLMQWALLAERNGDGARARILQERAGRIRKPG